MKLKNKIALITGGGGELGKAAAISLAEEGAQLVVADLDEDQSKRTASEIMQMGGKAIHLFVDVTKQSSVAKMVEKTLQEFERIDILLNSAGIARGSNQWGTDNWKPMEEISKEDWQKIIDINLTGTFLCNQKVGRAMIKQKQGKIINVASVSGVVANRGLLGHGPYCASKAGVIALTKVLAMEWARYSINVNCISPGYMDTKMVEKVKQKLPQVHRLQVKMTPLNRFGDPVEFARCIVFLSSEDSNYITGHNLLMDGGYTIW